MAPDLDMKDHQTMRVALISLIALGAAIGSTAIAQDAPATMPMPMPAQPAPPPAPATQPTPEAPPATPAPDATAVPAPEAPPAAPEPPPPPPPRTPSDPTSLAVLNVLQNICLPMAKGGDLASLAKPLGFRLKKDLWVQQYQKGYTIAVHPAGSNPGVCNVDIDHPINGVTEVIIDLHNWAMARDFTLYRNDKYSTDMERSTRSWELNTATSKEALVLVTVRKLGDKPMTARTDHTELLYSFKATPAA